jgi:hypothetical protein
MSDSPKEGRQSFFDGLLWYLSVRNWAYEKIIACPHGSQIFDVRMCHSLYFVTLLGATDHISDHLKNNEVARSAFEGRLEAGFTGTQNLKYVRELRNAIIHRGLDPAAAAHSDGTFLHVLCPGSVPDRRNKETYTCTFKYMSELAIRCNIITNSAIAYTLDQLGMFDPSCHIVSEEEVNVAISASTAMPDWAKELARSALPVMNLPALASSLTTTRINQMRALLR